MTRRSSLTLAVGATLAASCGPQVPPENPCRRLRQGDVVITELMIDPDGADTGSEWIEIFNPGRSAIDLTGLTLYLQNPDGSGSKSHRLSEGSVPPRAYWVLGDVRSGLTPSWLNASYGDDLGALSNSQGQVGLRCDALTLAELTYATAAKPGRSRMLDGTQDPTDAAATSEGNYCDAPVGDVYAEHNAGTPGARNPPCAGERQEETCLDHGTARAIHPPSPGELRITEVMTSPAASGDSTGEWLEVLARAPLDLNGLSFGTSTDSAQIAADDCLHVDEGQYVLLARSADSFLNGSLPAPRYVYDSLSFADTSNQRVLLRYGDAGIDQVALLASSSGHSWQLDPRALDSTSTDDPSHFCQASAPWNVDGEGDDGSPGAPNPPCPEGDAGAEHPASCFDTASMTIRAPVQAKEGDLVITEWLSNPGAIPDAVGEYVEVLAKGHFDLNGLTLKVGPSLTHLASSNCLSVAPDSYLLFGKMRDPARNGNLPALTAVFAGALSGTSTIAILSADGGLLDSITASGETAGASVQIRPGSQTPETNDDPLNQCTTPPDTRYGPHPSDGGATGNRGTPGRPNVPCSF